MSEARFSLKTIRRNCLECSDSLKAVTWCGCDGVNSTRCEFWPFRFGQRPGNFRKWYGDRLVTPELMPPADLEIDLLPATLMEAASGAIDVPGYQQPAVELPKRPKRELTAEEKAKLGEQFGWGPKQGRDHEMAPVG